MSSQYLNNNRQSYLCTIVAMVLATFLPLECLAETLPERVPLPPFMYARAWKQVKESYYDRNFNGQNWERWEHHYDGKLKTVEDAQLAISTMLASLGNAKTCLLPSSYFGESTIKVGVGITPEAWKGRMIVSKVRLGSSAALAGIQPGDELISVGGETVAGITVTGVRSMLRGELGSSIKCGLRRPGSPIKQVSLARVSQAPNSILVVELAAETDLRIGYIRIESFEPSNCIAELTAGLHILQSCDGLVLDLRGNPGGSLSSTYSAVCLFLHKFPQYSKNVDNERPGGFYLDQKGKVSKHFLEIPKDYVENDLVVFSTIDADGYENMRVCEEDAVYSKPLVILTDEQTAAAAIIFCAALVEDRRAVLVGSNANPEPQLMDNVGRLEDGSGISISVARWQTPHGHDFSGTGLPPTWRVSVSPKDKLAGKGPWWVASTSFDPRHSKDVQFLKAVQVLREKLSRPEPTPDPNSNNQGPGM